MDGITQKGRQLAKCIVRMEGVMFQFHVNKVYLYV